MFFRSRSKMNCRKAREVRLSEKQTYRKTIEQCLQYLEFLVYQILYQTKHFVKWFLFSSYNENERNKSFALLSSSNASVSPLSNDGKYIFFLLINEFI